MVSNATISCCAAILFLKNSSFYQDRLGTNIGEELKKEIVRFLAG